MSAFFPDGTLRQARVVDISYYYRTGGINWPRLKENFDFGIIRAGVDLWPDPLLREHVDNADAYDFPYATYYFIDPDRPVDLQAAHYASAYGVKGHRMFYDWEKPWRGGRIPSAQESYNFLKALEDKTGERPKIYSRGNIFEANGDPRWLGEYELWISQYWKPYRTYGEFLVDFEWKLPPDIRDKHYAQNCILWQFTEKGDARYYLSNATTNDPDPDCKKGVLSADLNVSMADVRSFLKSMGETYSPLPPPPPPPPIPVPPAEKYYTVNTHALNGRAEPVVKEDPTNVVLSLAEGNKVKLIGESGLWKQVEVKETVWMHSHYLKATDT